MLSALMLGAALAGCASAAKTPAATGAPPDSRSTVQPAGGDAWNKGVEAAAKEGTLTIYSFNLVGESGLKLAEAFQKRYGVKLEIVTGRGAEFVERLKTERRLGQKTADISEGSITNLLQMKADGFTAVLKGLPVLESKGIWVLDPLATDGEGHVVSYTPYTVTPWVNTNLVKPGQEPRSFQDLLKPEWKGKIITDDPATSSSVYLYYLPLVNAGVLDWEYVKAMGKQDMLTRTGPIQMTQALARGDAPVMLLNVDSIVSPFVKDGAPIRAISLAEGDVVGANGIAVMSEGPHPNAARVFVDWLLGQEGQALYNSLKSTAPVRKDVTDFRPAAARVSHSRLVVTTAKDYAETASLMMERFLAGVWKQ